MIGFELRKPGHTQTEEVYVGRITGRKSPVLGVTSDGTFRVLAYFRDQDSMEEAARLLRLMSEYTVLQVEEE